MKLWGLPAGAIVATCLLLASCGDGADESSTTVRRGVIPATFIAKVNAICAEADRRYSAGGPFPFKDFDPVHPDPALLPKVGVFFQPHLATDQTVEQQLRAVGEPVAGATQWDALRALAIEAEESAKKQVQAALQSDVAAFAATAAQAQRLHDEIVAKARAVGFAESSPCGKIF